MKTKEEIVEYLVRKYNDVWDKFDRSYEEPKLDGQVDLFDEIFEECFGVKDIYFSDGKLIVSGRDLEIVVKEAK